MCWNKYPINFDSSHPYRNSRETTSPRAHSSNKKKCKQNITSKSPTETLITRSFTIIIPFACLLIHVFGNSWVFLAKLIPYAGKGVLQLNSLFQLPIGQVHSKAKHHRNASGPDKLSAWLWLERQKARVVRLKGTVRWNNSMDARALKTCFERSKFLRPTVQNSGVFDTCLEVTFLRLMPAFRAVKIEIASLWVP